jgi:hypothetical protein
MLTTLSVNAEVSQRQRANLMFGFNAFLTMEHRECDTILSAACGGKPGGDLGVVPFTPAAPGE